MFLTLGLEPFLCRGDVRNTALGDSFPNPAHFLSDLLLSPCLPGPRVIPLHTATHSLYLYHVKLASQPVSYSKVAWFPLLPQTVQPRQAPESQEELAEFI
jgi:hypothetical protein